MAAKAKTRAWPSMPTSSQPRSRSVPCSETITTPNYNLQWPPKSPLDIFWTYPLCSWFSHRPMAYVPRFSDSPSKAGSRSPTDYFTPRPTKPVVTRLIFWDWTRLSPIGRLTSLYQPYATRLTIGKLFHLSLPVESTLIYALSICALFI